MPAMQYTIFQMIHQRPIPYHMTLPFLTTDTYAELSATSPTLQWMARPSGQPAPESVGEDIQALSAAGIRWVALHPQRLPPQQRLSAISALEAALGAPDLQEPMSWMCWEIHPASP